MNSSRNSRVLALSCGLYGLLLRAYPAAYRREWAEPMAQLFRDCSAEEFDRHGHLGLATLWVRTLGDFVRSLAREYLRRRRPRLPAGARVPPSSGPLVNFTFTPRAQQALALARKEAVRLGHGQVGTEHLLLGIALLDETLATRTLVRLGVDVNALRAETERRAASVPHESKLGAVPFTPPVKKALALAGKEARSLGHTYLGTEHLLLGLMREGEGVAALVLNEFGVRIARCRAEFLRDPGFAGRMLAANLLSKASSNLLRPGQLRHVQFEGEGKYIRQNGQENTYGHINLRLTLIAGTAAPAPAVVTFSAGEHELPDAQWAVVQRALLRWHHEHRAMFGRWRLVLAVVGGSCDPAATPAFGEAAVIAATEATHQAVAAKVLGPAS